VKLPLLLLLAATLAGPAAAQSSDATALPPEEGHFVPLDAGGLRVHLRHQPPAGSAACPATSPVLFVHGATFPSALAAAFRFDGVSWMTDLAARGFDVWALDFLGYGESDRYPEMREPAAANPPLGRAPEAARQIAAAAAFIASRSAACRPPDSAKVSLVAHSWGTVAAGRYTAEHPGRVDRLVLFGPVTRRDGDSDTSTAPAWQVVTADEQAARFTGYVPEGESAVFDSRHLAVWGPAYLASDPTSGERTPPSVRVPNGPIADLMAAWSGRLPYDPAMITVPTLIVRGEWETVTADADARWLYDALTRAPVRRDVKIGRATHVMHLETGRRELYAETAAFLAGEGAGPTIARP
jgi:pimeloyl-ACP methyl ester carboxylesterase